MSKCIGCGAVLNTNKDTIGYTSNINGNLCERCFRIRNYNEYKVVVKDNSEYIDILKSINGNDLVILVVDLLNINDKLDEIGKYLNNNILLVLTKYDLMPSNNEDKFKSFFNKFNLNIVDTVIISSNNNYNLDLLLDCINKYKTSNKIYVVGFTNAGKSSMINKLLYNYSDSNLYITTSNLPSTTLNTIEIKFNDLILIDTPGLLDNSIVGYLDNDLIKKIIPKKKIKPITFQVKDYQVIDVENILKVECNNTNLTFYMSNNLNINRYYKNVDFSNLVKHSLSVKKGEDIVILGLGFIHVSSDSDIIIYVVGDTSVFVRDALIGGNI